MHLTAVLKQEGKLVTSFCPELDVASQGATFEEAKDNLKEAVELLLDESFEGELKSNLMEKPILSTFEVLK
jgi:hypothetical protein